MKKTHFKTFKKIKPEYIILTIILIFGLFLRVYSLGIPPLWVDEFISADVSLNILEKGIPSLDSGLGYSRALLFHYLQAFFLLFGQTDFLVRFVSVIFGMLTIILAYFIGKEYSKTGGIISALFMSVFYLEIFFSRQARFYQLFQLMFFLSIYLLYKSKPDKNNKKSNIYLYLSLASLFITINTQPAGLVLCPFFIIHILIYSKKYRKYLAVLPLIPLIQKFITIIKLPSGSSEATINYANNYFGFARNIHYLLMLFIPGVIWAFIKKKRLTILMILPSLILLAGVVSLKTFALRYAYFLAFPLVLYTSLLLSFLYEKFGKIMLITIALVLIFPSNLVFPHTGVNIIKPIDYNYYDYSAPEINLKDIPKNLKSELINPNNILISYFSLSAEWYLRKPDYVIPFSLNGIDEDQVSYNKTLENKETETIEVDETKTTEIIDVYSGAPILKQGQIPDKPYYLLADSFSTIKLNPSQRDNLNSLTKDCQIEYENRDVRIYECVL